MPLASASFFAAPRLPPQEDIVVVVVPNPVLLVGAGVEAEPRPQNAVLHAGDVPVL